MDPTTKVVLIVVGAISALIMGGGGVLWVTRISVSAIVKQNGKLVETLIDSSNKQVEASNDNTVATRDLAAKIDRYIAVGDERNRTASKQLDRIEAAAVRRRRGEEPGTVY